MKLCYLVALTLSSSTLAQRSQGFVPPATPVTATPPAATPATATPAPASPPRVTPTPPPAPPAPYTAPSVDWSQNGRNWADDLCVTGGFQSPVNIESKSTKESNKVKFAFDFKSYENLTLQLNDPAGQLSVNLSDYSRANPLNLWNEKGEYFQYFLEGYQWKVPSEHTIDNRQYSAELQILHKQFATQRKVMLSILFDEEIYLRSAAQNKLKTCFVDSFKFTQFQNKTNDLEIPLREYLQFIPQDFYYYEGSMTQPPCQEHVIWVVFKQPQVITTTQIQQLKSLIKLPKGNTRETQQLSTGRTVYLGGSQQVKYSPTLTAASSSIQAVVANILVMGIVMLSIYMY